MAIIEVYSRLIEEHSVLRLAEYGQFVNHAECPFWGVAHDTEDPVSCRMIWMHYQRQMVARYLAEAQDEIEQTLGYPLGERWFTEDQVRYKCPDLAPRGHVIQGGVMASSDISITEAVNHATDPAVIGPVATTVTNEEEIVVYHPGTTITIDPSSITIAGGNVTIEIPRCRMVILDSVDNPEPGLDYADPGNFEITVDIVRVYNDPSTHAVLISNHSCTAACASQGCTEYTQDACIYVTQPEIGAFQALPSDYADGVWSRKACTRSYEWIELNYQAGVDMDTWKWRRQAKDAIIRLAHSKMPTEPCGCDPVQSMWRADNTIPDGLTAERINCPFGLSNGAWMAWKFAKAMKLWRLGII